MRNRYLFWCFARFAVSLVLCVPLWITLVRIFTLRLANPFSSPYLCTASVLWSLVYGGALYAFWRLRDVGWTGYGILLYGCLAAANSVWINYFER